MNKRVSIVVPVYNVEKFLDDCIKSILSQTYKNLEIIIVNDGSTDKSYELCQGYCSDDRVKIFDKINGGLSSARNVGIKIATGDYISFIDSDDYIREDMIEKLVNSLEQNDADVSCCNFDFCDENSKILNVHKVNNFETEVLNSEQAISMLLYEEYYKCYAWNKIYRRSLFDDVEYPEGKLYEDITTTYKIFKKSSKVVFIKDALYHYRVRNNSITKKKFNKKNYDLLEALKFVSEDSSNEDIHVGALIYYLYFIDDSIQGNQWDESVYHYYKDNYNKYRKKIFKSDNISLLRKIQMMMCAMYPKLYKKVYSLMSK